MKLTQEDIKEFQGIYEAEFCEALGSAEASHMASQLMVLYERLAAPLPSEGARPLDVKGPTTIR